MVFQMINNISIQYTKPNYPIYNPKNQQNEVNFRNKNCTKTQPISSANLLAYIAHFKKTPFLEVEFYNTPSSSELEKKYGKLMQEEIKDLNTRAGKAGQILNWIEILPKTQLQRLDAIYKIAGDLKQHGSKKLGIIGIGGSKHTIENLLSLNNLQDNVVFLSAVDPTGIDNFIKSLGNLDDACIMIASKSGTTLETATGYEFVYKKFLDEYTKSYINKGYTPNAAESYAKTQIANHFICVTDENPQKSALKKIAKEKNYKCGIIHDDCGGRFGAFDDHSLIALAYCGFPKSKMKQMLESVITAQKKYLNPDLKTNLAAQRAMFNADSVINGKTEQTDYYFGHELNGCLLWNTQLKKESHKSLYKQAGDLMGPEFLHNSAESDLDSKNNKSFYTFNLIQSDKTQDFTAYNALINGALKAYSNQHPVSVIRLKDLSPESIAQFIELKHFETIYTGMLLRRLRCETSTDVLPEVEQPNVKIYKKEVEKILNQR